MGREGKQRMVLEVRQLALSKEPAGMRIRYHGERADIPSKGISYNKFLYALNILIHDVCVYLSNTAGS
jgi:hypothetical protein